MKRLGLFIISLFIFFMLSCSSGTYVGRTYSSYPNSYGYNYSPGTYNFNNNDPYLNGYSSYPYSNPGFQNYNYGYGWNYYPYNYIYYHNYDRSNTEMW